MLFRLSTASVALCLFVSTQTAAAHTGSRFSWHRHARHVAERAVALSCPSADGTTYNGFQIYCSTDFYGGDMSSQATDTLEACIDLCASTSGCIDISYNGICYLKNTLTAAQSNANVIGAALPGRYTASSSSTTTTKPTTTSSTAASATTTSTAALSCPASNGQTYLGFQIYCSTDFFGGDMINQYASTLEECIQACKSTSGCVDISYTNNICYLKSTLTAAQSNGNVIGAALPGLVPTSSTTSSTISTSASTTASSGVSSSLSCPSANQQTYNGFSIACGTDYIGGDMSNLQAPSLEDCVGACQTTAGCVAISYVGGTCYLKSTLNPGVSNSAVTGASLQSSTGSSSSTTSSGATSSATISCPGSDGTTFRSSWGAQYVVACATDYNGGDLSSIQAASMDACLNTCSSTSSCIGASYANGFCYMKSTIGPGQSNGNVISAKLLNSGSSTTSSGSSSAPSSTTTSTTGSSTSQSCVDGATFRSASGAQYRIACGTDYYGNDLQSQQASSFEACMNLCSTTASCTTVSYTGGFCYLKSGTSGSTSNANIVGATLVSSTTSTTSSSTTSSISSSSTSQGCVDGAVFRTSSGAQYRIACGTDYYGNDISSQQTGSFEECMNLCSTTTSCTTVSYTGGFCYLKSSASGSTSNANVVGAVLITSAQSSTSSTTSSVSQTSTTASTASSTSTTMPVQTTTTLPTTTTAAATTTTSQSPPTTSTTTSVAAVTTSASQSRSTTTTTSSAVVATTTTTSPPTTATTTTVAPITTTTATHASSTSIASTGTTQSTTTSTQASTTAVTTTTTTTAPIVASTTTASATATSSATSTRPSTTTSAAATTTTAVVVPTTTASATTTVPTTSTRLSTTSAAVTTTTAAAVTTTSRPTTTTTTTTTQTT